MADADLVEHVGVVDRDVTDDDVGFEEEGEHDFTDVTGLDDLTGGAAVRIVGFQRRLDQLAIYTVEVGLSTRRIFLDAGVKPIRVFLASGPMP